MKTLRIYKVYAGPACLGYYVGYNKIDAITTAKMKNNHMPGSFKAEYSGKASNSQQEYR